MSFDTLPTLQDVWSLMKGEAEPVTATPHGFPADPERSHLDLTTYYSKRGGMTGISGGVGVWDRTPGSPPPHLDARFDVGRYTDRDGADAFGINVEGSAGSEYHGEHAEVGTASASARAQVSSKGAAFGIQADGPQVASINRESGTAGDEMHRFGFSPIGPGLELRGHWDDADGDGLRELGFGADIGDFSFDFTTEDPLRSLARSASFERIGGHRGAPEDSERNWTAEAVESVSNLFGHFAD
jgi:hypothetical protein